MSGYRSSAGMRCRVRGCTGKTTGMRSATAWSCSSTSAQEAMPSTRDGRCSVTSTNPRSLELELPGEIRSAAKPRLEAAEGVDHRVPDEVDALGLDALPTQVLDRIVRVGEQMVGELVRDDPVDLLRHRAIEAPQARLDVRVGDAELDEHERCSQRRVDVTRDEREVRWVSGDDRLEPLHRRVPSARHASPIRSRAGASARGGRAGR